MLGFTLRKHAYSNILKISPPKTESFQTKISDIFHISAQNIDCGYSLEPPRHNHNNNINNNNIIFEDFVRHLSRLKYSPKA